MDRPPLLSLLPLLTSLLLLLGGVGAVPSAIRPSGPPVSRVPREILPSVSHDGTPSSQNVVPAEPSDSLLPDLRADVLPLKPLTMGPSMFQAPPPPAGVSPKTPVLTEPAPPGVAPPAGPIAEPKPPRVSRQRRAADEPPASTSEKLISTGKRTFTDSEKKPRRVSSTGAKRIIADGTRHPADIQLPKDVELVPGFNAPPGYEAPAEGEGGGRDADNTPTPPKELPGGAAGSNETEPINYEGLYYTIFAENNTHEEIRTPLAELATSGHTCRAVRSVPSRVRRQLGLSHFYQRYTEAYGIPVLSSSRVPDAALRRACYIVRFLFADLRAVRDSYRQRRGRVAVIGRGERTTQIPEHSSLGPAWDKRARGLGATDAAPVCTIGEENLLNYGYPADRWHTEDIGLHEFAHGMHLLGARYAMPDWERRLKATYDSAIRRGLWRNTYAATNHIEYFAEGVQKYHNVEAFSQRPNGIHNHVDTRAKLKQYDPMLHKLIAEMFPCGNRYIGRREGGFQAASDAARLKVDYPSCRLDGTTDEGPRKPTPTKQPRPESTTRFREFPTARTTTRAPARTTRRTTTRITTPAPPKQPCRDNHRHCASWARAGYCFSYAGYMSANCRRSCRVCGKCRDKNAHCAGWAARGECKSNPGYMLYNCRNSCRVG